MGVRAPLSRLPAAARCRDADDLPGRIGFTGRAARRSALRGPAGRSPPMAPRSALSIRSGTPAKWASPSSDVKTAPPIRAAPHRPVRIVPENHWADTRRRSTVTPVPPSTDSGGSLPRSIRSISLLCRFAPRLPWSNSWPLNVQARQTSRTITRPGSICSFRHRSRCAPPGIRSRGTMPWRQSRVNCRFAQHDAGTPPTSDLDPEWAARSPRRIIPTRVWKNGRRMWLECGAAGLWIPERRGFSRRSSRGSAGRASQVQREFLDCNRC